VIVSHKKHVAAVIGYRLALSSEMLGTCISEMVIGYRLALSSAMLGTRTSEMDAKEVTLRGGSNDGSNHKF
jgi:hypothetical protein